MSTAARPGTDPRVRAVEVTDDLITAHLTDGRGIHWPDVDEDISLRGMLEGVPAQRPAKR